MNTLTLLVYVFIPVTSRQQFGNISLISNCFTWAGRSYFVSHHHLFVSQCRIDFTIPCIYCSGYLSYRRMKHRAMWWAHHLCSVETRCYPCNDVCRKHWTCCYLHHSDAQGMVTIGCPWVNLTVLSIRCVMPGDAVLTVTVAPFCEIFRPNSLMLDMSNDKSSSQRHKYTVPSTEYVALAYPLLWYMSYLTLFYQGNPPFVPLACLIRCMSLFDRLDIQCILPRFTLYCGL